MIFLCLWLTSQAAIAANLDEAGQFDDNTTSRHISQNILDDAIIGESYLVDNDEPQPWENDLDLAK